MKTPVKIVVLALAAVISAGGGFALAQTPAPQVYRPNATPQVNRPNATPQVNRPAATQRGSGSANARGPMVEQPRMVEARNALRLARLALEGAQPDKGGFREKAIANIDEALKNVEQGIAYASSNSSETGSNLIPRGAPGGRGVTVPGNAK